MTVLSFFLMIFTSYPTPLGKPCENGDSSGENRNREHEIKSGACRRGEEARTLQQVGKIEILRHGETEAAKQERHEGDGGNDGHGVQYLARQKRNTREGGNEQNDGQPLDGDPESDELRHGHTRLTSEHGEALHRCIPRGELKGLHSGGQVDGGKCREQDCCEGQNRRVFGKEQPPSSLSRGFQDIVDAAADLVGEHARKQKQDEAVKQVVKALREQGIPPRIVDEVGVISRGLDGQDVVPSCLNAGEMAVTILGVVVFVHESKVFLLGDLAFVVIGYGLIEAVLGGVDAVAFRLHVRQLFLGQLARKGGHVLLVHAVREGFGIGKGLGGDKALGKQNNDNNNDELIGQQELTHLCAEQGAAGHGDGSCGELDGLLGFDLYRALGTAESKGRQRRKGQSKDGEQTDSQGDVGHGFLKHVEGVVPRVGGFGVHDCEQVEHIKGARLFQRDEEVQHEVDRYSTQRGHEGQGVLLDEHREQHNEGSQRKQHQDLGQHRDRQQLAHGDDLGAEFEVLEHLDEVAEGGESVARAVKGQRGGGEQHHGEGGEQSQRAQLVEESVQSALLGGVEDGVHPRGEFLDAESGSQHQHEHDEQDVTAGVGVVFVPTHGVFVVDGNEGVDLIDVLDVGLVLVFVVVFGHTRGEVVLFGDDGSFYHALQVLGVGVDFCHVLVGICIIPVLFGIIIQFPSILVSIRILLIEFLHFLLHLWVKHLVVVGSQAVVLVFPRFGIVVIGLQGDQHILGQIVCGGVLGLGVRQKSIQEEQEDEQAEDEFVADEFFAFVSNHALFLIGYVKYCHTTVL